MKKVLITVLTLSLASCGSKPDPQTSKPGYQNSGNAKGSWNAPLSASQEVVIADEIFKNETGGDAQNLVAWNNGEDFASLGIAHFTWIPSTSVQSKKVLGESFPLLMQFMESQKVPLPPPLDALKPKFDCPWPSNRDEVLNGKYKNDVAQIREFLNKTRPIQFRFAYQVFQKGLTQIIESAAERKAEVQDKVDGIAGSPAGVFPLIDYVNFKGTGLGTGSWGLKQVLLEMKGTDLASFVDAAEAILQNRVAGRPQDKSFLPGWIARVQRYETFALPQ